MHTNGMFAAVSHGPCPRLVRRLHRQAGEFVVSTSGGIGENAQGRLERMRKIASLRARTLDDLAPGLVEEDDAGRAEQVEAREQRLVMLGIGGHVGLQLSLIHI